MKRGVKTILSGGLVILLGSIIIPGVFVLLFTLQIIKDSNNSQFLVPGSIEVEVTEPGRYYLWNDYQTLFNGTSYNEPPTLPSGLTFTFTDEQSNTLAFTSDTSFSSTSGSNVSDSIGYIDVTQPGKIKVDVTGPVTPRVFSFGKNVVWKIIGTVFGSVALVLTSLFVGVGLMLWGFIKLMNNKQDEPVTIDLSI